VVMHVIYFSFIYCVIVMVKNVYNFQPKMEVRVC